MIAKGTYPFVGPARGTIGPGSACSKKKREKHFSERGLIHPVDPKLNYCSKVLRGVEKGGGRSTERRG